MNYCYWCGKPIEDKYTTTTERHLFCSDKCRNKKKTYNLKYKSKDIARHLAMPDQIFIFNDLWREEMKELKYELNWKQDHPLHAFNNECLFTLKCCLDKIETTNEEKKVLGALTQTIIDKKDGIITTDKEDWI